MQVNDFLKRLEQFNSSQFEDWALEIFNWQFEQVAIYQQYCTMLGISPHTVQSIKDIPFLPISFFKTHHVYAQAAPMQPEMIFESSGTTQTIQSKHAVAHLDIYHYTAIQGFENYFGSLSNYTILALLPSYLERPNASLVYMVKQWLKANQQTAYAFYMHDHQSLANTIKALQRNGKKVLLIGVTFALIDFAMAYPMSMKDVTVIETGGMKGRAEEWTKAKLFSVLKSAWPDVTLCSEYGMTELLSQSYSNDQLLYTPSITKRVFTRDINDPLSWQAEGLGALNIIDIANVYSCSFIATEDVGRVYKNGQFEVLGRMDHSALRGCSLMAVH